MSGSVPPHYTGFRLALVATIVLVVIGGLWGIFDGMLFQLVHVRW